MSHPIIALQATLVSALVADTALVTSLGGTHVFDAPPQAFEGASVVIIRHDVLPRNGDDAPGYDHRLLLHCRTDQPSRKAVIDLVERVIAVALTDDLSSADLRVTHVQHDRTDTAIDLQSGSARAAIALRCYSEPVS